MSDTDFTISMPKGAEMRMSKAILIYDAGSGQSFATVNDIEHVNGCPVIQPGRPASPRAARAALSKLTRPEPSGYIPGEVLYRSGSTVMWWVKPAVRRIAFNCADIAPSPIEVELPHPGLVFLAGANKGWSVWALKGVRRPDPGTRIYAAPYLNVSERGIICAGSTVLPRGTGFDKLAQWTAAFFTSRFTHVNGAARRIGEGSLYAFWRAMIAGEHGKRFPTKLLVPNGSAKTLGALIEEVSRV